MVMRPVMDLVNMLVICILVVIGSGHCMYSSKELEGYPAGFMADCPGSDKEAIITKNTLKNLSMTVVSTSNPMKEIRRKYNYYQMKELAKDPLLDFNKRTVLYIGGFLDSPNFPIPGRVAKVYNSIGYNVLLLDTSYFTTYEYPRASRLARPVGVHGAKMLFELKKQGLDPKKLDVVGLSLGVHTASFIAKNFRLITGVNISRITALDPSGPCFRNLGPEDRIDKSDADFVEMIATNIDGYGMAAPVGHVNYYVNGGEFQPGELVWFLCMTLCSHIRSYMVWLSALQHPNSFIAMQCDSVQQARFKKCRERKPLVTNLMGLKVDKKNEGIFYLATSAAYPYYLSERGLKQNSDLFKSLAASFNKEKLVKVR
ncbi:pancreatic lipase-related protein 2 [Danaus plexippus plexippus]|uniref:Pancreatic lipase-related protein 2 n=1 Tax=Danaus plexippus plexippus TaxID=278856 RepID=A0A212FBR8_DANPL|nr:pancreatic lipase-related protein 2 [Danaus plexippus plexippus]